MPPPLPGRLASALALYVIVSVACSGSATPPGPPPPPPPAPSPPPPAPPPAPRGRCLPGPADGRRHRSRLRHPAKSDLRLGTQRVLGWSVRHGRGPFPVRAAGRGRAGGDRPDAGRRYAGRRRAVTESPPPVRPPRRGDAGDDQPPGRWRSEEHTSEL